MVILSRSYQRLGAGSTSLAHLALPLNIGSAWPECLLTFWANKRAVSRLQMESILDNIYCTNEQSPNEIIKGG